jgi:hypothetical protein
MVVMEKLELNGEEMLHATGQEKLGKSEVILSKNGEKLDRRDLTVTCQCRPGWQVWAPWMRE